MFFTSHQYQHIRHWYYGHACPINYKFTRPNLSWRRVAIQCRERRLLLLHEQSTRPWLGLCSPNKNFHTFSKLLFFPLFCFIFILIFNFLGCSKISNLIIYNTIRETNKKLQVKFYMFFHGIATSIVKSFDGK